MMPINDVCWGYLGSDWSKSVLGSWCHREPMDTHMESASIV